MGFSTFLYQRQKFSTLYYYYLIFLNSKGLFIFKETVKPQIYKAASFCCDKIGTDIYFFPKTHLFSLYPESVSQWNLIILFTSSQFSGSFFTKIPVLLIPIISDFNEPVIFQKYMGYIKDNKILLSQIRILISPPYVQFCTVFFCFSFQQTNTRNTKGGHYALYPYKQ